jgi:membrane protein
MFVQLVRRRCPCPSRSTPLTKNPAVWFICPDGKNGKVTTAWPYRPVRGECSFGPTTNWGTPRHGTQLSPQVIPRIFGSPNALPRSGCRLEGMIGTPRDQLKRETRQPKPGALEHPTARTPTSEHTRLEADRSRSAETPLESPRRGWRDIFLRVYRGISEDRILLVAAGVTFYLLLSIFPGIGTLISIYGLFADPADVTSHLNSIANVAPGGAIQVLHDELTRLAARGGTTLGTGFLVSLVISVWTANSGVSAIFDALNIVYKTKEKRSLLRYYLSTLTFTVGAVIFALLSITVVVAVPVILNFLPLPGGTDLFVKVVRWPILFVLVALVLAVLYRYAPSRNEARWYWITWGSAFATCAWVGVSVLFSWYVANFGSYNKTYGSLGAIIGFMTWIWLSVIVVLVGAKLDAEMERRTAR